MASEKLHALGRYIVWDRLAPLLDQRWVTPVSNWYYENFASEDVRRQWADRIGLVVRCADNTFIKRVSEAGRVRGHYQLMHNGQEVIAGGYCGLDMLRMLELNRGVHEPQEERVFQDVLPYIPEGATMIELGSYWAFYSMWFLQQVKQSRSILVEPTRSRMAIGKHNLKRNGLKAEFLAAHVGQNASIPFDDTPAISVDEILKSRRIETLHILHADIQGAELEMLEGCEEAFKNKRIHFIFISTHSNQLHDACAAKLKDRGFEILASINMDDSYSEDGLLVGKLSGIPGPGPFALSLRSKEPADSRDALKFLPEKFKRSAAR